MLLSWSCRGPLVIADQVSGVCVCACAWCEVVFGTYLYTIMYYVLKLQLSAVNGREEHTHMKGPFVMRFCT